MKKIYQFAQLLLVVLAGAQIAKAQTTTYNYTGGTQTYTVPAGVSSIIVDARGGQGGGVLCEYPGGGINEYQSTGGCGGRVQATLNVTPGHVLNITVGGGGIGSAAATALVYGGGGRVTGWSTVWPSASGGGGSTVVDATAGATLVVAGGGGGGGGDFCASAMIGLAVGDRGGDGGGLVGAAGNSDECGIGFGGQGGTQVAGGAAGTCFGYTGMSGSAGVGGNSVTVGGVGGVTCGAGGGGYYGGGSGGDGSGGGGGSSYTNPLYATAVIHTQGYNCIATTVGAPTGATGEVIITVNCSAGTITGATGNVCVGSSISVTDVTAGGTWSSSPTTIATVSGAGLVTGVAAGTATISYNVSGCSALYVVTVYAVPTAILGTLTVCAGGTTSLSDAVAGGTWSSLSPATATISAAGLVSGIIGGTSTIVYSMGGGACTTSAVVTVNPSPVAISGTPNMCVGLTATVSDAAAGGTWSSSNPGIASVSPTGVITGAGAGGTATITYTLPGNCYVTIVATVNPAPSAILGTPVVCQGLTTSLTDLVAGGAWSSTLTGIATVNPATGLVTGVSGGTSTIIYTSSNCTPVSVVVTVNPILPINGTPASVCTGLTITLSDAVPGGTWASGSPGIAFIGLSSGVVSGITPGTSTIIYTTPANCTASTVVTVNPSPAPISGTTSMCLGQVAILSDASAGGNWTSGNIGVATIAAGSGFTTAVGVGTATIIYTLPAGCTATMVITVNPLPAAISGSPTVCAGVTDPLSDATPGGGWSSSAPSIAMVDAISGVVTGISAGTAIITYLLPTGCSATLLMTVNPSPVAIVGNHNLCVGLTTPLTDPTSGGTWSSSNTAVATIITGTGLATGITTGTSTITYTLSAGCTATTTITVNPVPGAINGVTDGCIGFTTVLTDATPGGTWSSASTGTATVGLLTGLVTAVSAGTATISYALTTTGCYATTVFTVNPPPAAISGAPYICETLTALFSDATGGGTWSSSDPTKATVDAAGLVTGVAHGTATITYTLPTTCYRVYMTTIEAAPTAINGSATVCVGSTTTLTDGVTGGNWTLTSYSGTATIGATSGIVTGLTPGTVMIYYTTFACNPVNRVMSVNPLPTGILGEGSVCANSSTTVSDATPGGTWSASGGASISSTGVVTGLTTSSGTTVTYKLPTGCYVTAPIVVSPIPTPILGADSVCPGSSVFLSDTTPGGVWSSSDGTIALSIAYTGEVEGLVSGNVHISYTLISGCYTTKLFLVSTPIPVFLSVNSSPADTFLCHNTPDTLTAIPNGVDAAHASFTWELFGSYIGSGNPFVYNPTHGDFLTCVMTTHGVCAAPAVVAKDVVLNVWPLAGPIVVISCTQPDTTAYLGEVYTFYSTVTFGGPSPSYQWYINNAPVPGATLPVFTTHIYNDNDSVYCVVHGDSPCDTGSYVGTSNTKFVVGQGYLSVGSMTNSSNDLTLFPNPNRGSFILSGTVNATTDKEVNLEVTDMLGRIIYTGTTIPQNGSVRAEIKLNNEAAGSYLLRVHTDTGSQAFHFVIDK